MQPVRVALQQRVIPNYRVPFLEMLAANPQIELSVFAGEPRPDEIIPTANRISGAAFLKSRNIHLFSGGFYFCYQPELVPWLKRTKPQVLILEANPRYPASRGAVRWAVRNNAGLIGWGLGVPQHHTKLAILRRHFQHSFLRQFDAILAYSRRGASQYIAAGLPAERVFTAFNAAAPRPSGPAPVRPPAFQGGQPVLLYVGRLQPRKKLDDLIRICAGLPDDLKPQLWIVGEGPIKADLVTLAREVYPATRFWGARYGAELDSIYRQADLFVLPGTGGLAVQEAMAAGLPVIVAAGDGTQSDLVRPENGWVVRPNDPQQLKQAVLQALQHPEDLRRMGMAAYRIIQEEVNLEKMVSVFLEAITTTLEHKQQNA